MTEAASNAIQGLADKIGNDPKKAKEFLVGLVEKSNKDFERIVDYGLTESTFHRLCKLLLGEDFDINSGEAIKLVSITLFCNRYAEAIEKEDLSRQN